jgi:hypothetical protein
VIALSNWQSTLAYAGTLAAILWAAGGVGLLAVGVGGCATWRSLAGQMLIGFLGYTVVLTTFGQFSLDLVTGAALVCVYFVVGLGALLWHWKRDRTDMRRRHVLAIGVGVSTLATSVVPGNTGALDPLTYAYVATVMFQANWVSTQLAHLSTYVWLYDTLRDLTDSRLGSLSTLWPVSALGFGVDMAVVYSTAAWLIAVCAVLIVDLLPRQLPLWFRLFLAASAIGVFNEMSVLSGGQINQALSLCTALAVVWCSRWFASTRARAVAFAVGAATITAAYPEFLAALPLYFLCAALVREHTLTEGAAMIAATVLGVAAVLTASAQRILLHLFSEMGQAPGWWPLASEPRNALELWAAVVFQRTLPLWAIVLVIPLGVAILYGTLNLPRLKVAPNRMVRPIVGALALGVVMWSVLALRSPNVNYASFKLGGWIGPGLLLACCLLAHHLRARLQTFALGLVVLISTFRVVGLAADTAGKLIYYANPMTMPGWSREVEHGACVVHAAADEPQALMIAIAGSSAPRFNCGIHVP